MGQLFLGKLLLGKLVIGEIVVGEIGCWENCFWGSCLGEVVTGEVALGKKPNTVLGTKRVSHICFLLFIIYIFHDYLSIIDRELNNIIFYHFSRNPYTQVWIGRLCILKLIL